VNATALLLLLAVRHYGYYVSSQPALAWNVAGSAVIVAFVLAQWRKVPTWVRYVLAWWIAEEALVIGFNVAYMLDPWPVPAGADIGSSLLDFDLGKIGALVVAGLALHAARNDDA